MLEEKTKELGYKRGCVRQPAPRSSSAVPTELAGLHSPGVRGWAAGDRGLTGLPTTPARPRPAPHQVTSKRFGVATPTGRQAGQEPGSSSCTGGTCAPPPGPE